MARTLWLRRAILGLVLGGGGAASFAATTAIETLACPADGGIATLRVPFDAQRHGADIAVQGTAGALLEIEERDIDIAVARDTLAVALDSEAPPRFNRGFFAVDADGDDLRIGREVPSQSVGSAIVRLHCAPDSSTRALAAWLHELGTITAPARRMLPAADADTIVIQLEGLSQDAPDAWSRALARHWQAQALLMSDQTARAMPAFAATAAMWRAAGDTARAAAAEVAYVEDLQRLGRAADVLARTADVVVPDAEPYYAIRLRHAGCIAQRYLGRYDDADACLRESLRAFGAMDERAQMVSVVQDYADLKHLQGRDDEAEATAREVLPFVVGPETALFRGRLQLLRADIAMNRAQVPQALALLDDALAAFHSANATRWEGNTLLKLASLHRELGTLPEAYAAVTQAFALLSPRDAPARVATALVTLARIDEINGRAVHAVRWLTFAERIYARLGMALERDGVLAALALLAIDDDDGVKAKALLAQADPAMTYYRDRWALAWARAATAANDLPVARAALASQPRNALGLQMRIAFAIADARLKARAGDAADAARALESLHAEIAALASAAGNPLLRYLVARRLDTVTAAWLSNALADAGDVLPPTLLDRAWPLLRERARLMDLQGHGASVGPSVAALDREIAGDLLGRPAVTRTASSDLLRVLASGAHAQPASVSASTDGDELDAYVAVLGPGELSLSHLDGEDGGVLIWLSRDVRSTTRTPPMSKLAALADALRAVLASPKTPAVDIERHAAALSHALFADAGSIDPPARLRVDRDSFLAELPWAVLRWPGTNGLLADTTSVVLSPWRTGKPDASPRLDGIDIVMAGAALAGRDLPPIENITGEAASVRRIAQNSSIDSSVIPSPRRSDMFARFADGRRALHVAAHGHGESGRLGYAGLWLSGDAGPSADAEFLGWTEPLLRGVQSPLVVLNACSLANGRDSATASMSFAGALSRAGATHVVAALWPTSDAATTVWVPAFYEALLRDDANDAAVATSAAIDALRRSRMFRHPFYWASLVHFSNAD